MPPGYQPPPGYYPQQGYYYPQQGYYPPPNYYYPPAARQAPAYPPAPPRPAPRTRGFLALPFLGVATHLGDSGRFYDASASLGVMMGGRLSPFNDKGVRLSLDGELRFQPINFKDVPPGESWSGTQFEIGPSPLLHVPFQMGEFVVGPKIALFGYEANYTFPDTNGFDTTTRENWSGWSWGINTGAFFAVSRLLSLGAMVSLSFRKPLEKCVTPGSGVTAGIEECQQLEYAWEQVLGVHAAALF
jgi:hypothetical protein